MAQTVFPAPAEPRMWVCWSPWAFGALLACVVLAGSRPAVAAPPVVCGSPAADGVPLDRATLPLPAPPLAGGAPAALGASLGEAPAVACNPPASAGSGRLHDPAADAVHALTVPDLTQVIPSQGGD